MLSAKSWGGMGWERSEKEYTDKNYVIEPYEHHTGLVK